MCKYIDAINPIYPVKCLSVHNFYLYRFSFFVTGVFCNRCESGWMYYNNRCYMMYQKFYNFNKSRTYCKIKGGALASIPDDYVQTFLQTNGNLLGNRHICIYSTIFSV